MRFHFLRGRVKLYESLMLSKLIQIRTMTSFFLVNITLLVSNGGNDITM